MQIKNRNEFGKLLNKFKLSGFAVEVGVYKGEFAVQLLKTWKNLEKLFLIDCWKHQDPKKYVDTWNHDDKIFEEIYLQVKKLFQNNKHVQIIRAFSDAALNAFKDNTLDFVYLDANHSYESVKKDVSSWYKKVKSGGLLAGHDYREDGMFLGDLFGVKSAVDEFVKKHNLELFVTSDREDYPSWYVIKS